MKIIILHGDNTQKSYERLEKFIESAKSRSWEIVYLDGSNLNIQESLSSPSLFGAQRFFILRDLKYFNKKTADWLKTQYSDLSGTLIIYNEGTLSATFLNTLPKESKIEEFKLPKLIWSFLEHLYPQNSSKVANEFHQIIARDPPEFVFALISNLFRDLYWIKTDPVTANYPSWRASKLKSQSLKFTAFQLSDIIESLAEIDYRVKTGKADLVNELDLLFIRKLQ